MTKTPRGMNEAARDYKLEDTALQIRKIGNSVGVILPKELLARLNLKEGDKFYPVEQPDGSLRLSPFNPKHARTMEIARKIMRCGVPCRAGRKKLRGRRYLMRLEKRTGRIDTTIFTFSVARWQGHSNGHRGSLTG